MEIPKNLKGTELLKFLVENKEDILYAKKNTLKLADSLNIAATPLSFLVNKDSSGGSVDRTSIKVRAIINTTNVVDSHKDVHVDGIWNKSLNENKNIKFLQEHQMSFKTIIADKSDLEVSVNKVSWKSLGFDLPGKTEALTFDANVKASRNKEMFKEYSEGNVDNHSVGMRYQKLALAINSEDEDYVDEKAVWDKYSPVVANKEELEKAPYFFAVTEAKIIEGSSVVMGSNSFTPTIASENKMDQNKEIAVTLKWLGL